MGLRTSKRRTLLLTLSSLCCVLFGAGCLSPSSSGKSFDGATPSPAASPSPGSSPETAETPTPAPTSEPAPEETPVPEPTLAPGSGDACATLSTGTPRGLACLHCMHPNAHGQAFELARIMRDSCRADLALDVLIDGRFGHDDVFLGDLLHYLAEDRNVTVVLYLSNGVSQRLGDPRNPSVFGTGNTVSSFRTRIVNDLEFREEYRVIVRRALALRSRLPESAQLVLIPQLEDNLTDPIFRNVLALTQEVAGDTVLYGRSTCPGCADGNGIEIPGGVLEDLHSSSPVFAVENGMVTNDNSPFLFAYEMAQGQNGFSLSDLARTRDRAAAQGNIFIVWNAEYQGLPVADNKVIGRPDPDARSYVLPNPVEASELMNFLH